MKVIGFQLAKIVLASSVPALFRISLVDIVFDGLLAGVPSSLLRDLLEKTECIPIVSADLNLISYAIFFVSFFVSYKKT